MHQLAHQNCHLDYWPNLSRELMATSALYKAIEWNEELLLATDDRIGNPLRKCLHLIY
jgi:hypothetical protein